MAAFETNGQTLAALVEVGDKIRNGENPDDFMTVREVWHRPTYVKLELDSFDHIPAIVRIANTQILHLLTFNGADAPVDDCTVYQPEADD